MTDLRTVDVGVVMVGDARPVLVMEMLLSRLMNRLMLLRVEAACVHRHAGEGDRRHDQKHYKPPQHQVHSLSASPRCVGYGVTCIGSSSRVSLKKLFSSADSMRSRPARDGAVCRSSFRRGDADMRSVWLCSRNDVAGSLAVLLAASGVFATGTAWPDLLVAALMATLYLTATAQVVRHALAELQEHQPASLSSQA